VQERRLHPVSHVVHRDALARPGIADGKHRGAKPMLPEYAVDMSETKGCCSPYVADTRVHTLRVP